MSSGDDDGRVSGLVIDYAGTLVTVRVPDASLREANNALGSLLHILDGSPIRRPSDEAQSVLDAVGATIRGWSSGSDLRVGSHEAVLRSELQSRGLAADDHTVAEFLDISQRAWWPGIAPIDGAMNALKELRAAGLRLVICSNAPFHPATMRAQMAHLGFTELVDGIVLAGEIGWRKPSSQIFTAALGALGTPPRETIVVGDQYAEDVDGARKSSMRAVLVRGDTSGVCSGEEPWATVQQFAEVPRLARLHLRC